MGRPIPVQEAIALYEQFYSWRKVSEELRRPDGSKFTTAALSLAVRKFDRGLT